MVAEGNEGIVSWAELAPSPARCVQIQPPVTLYSLGSKCKPKPMDRIIRRMRGKADRRLYWQTNKLLSNFKVMITVF